MTGSMRVEFSVIALMTIVIASELPRVHAASHVTMSLRYNSGCAVKSDGDAVCWGAGADGALGTGSTSNMGGTMTNPPPPLTPQPDLPTSSIDLGSGRTAKMIDVSKHACAILDDDSLKCWGYNAAGQLGQNSLASIGDAPGELGDNLAAVNLGTGKTAKSVAVGGGHTCVILNDDTVKCFGYNLYGQLGYGDTTDRLTPSASAVNLGTGRNARSICAGEHHSCAILDDASVKCWGYNNGGQLGYGDVAARSDPSVLSGIRLGSGRTAKFIACGNEHTCAILDDDGIKCWGLGTGGRLGQDDATTSYGSQSVSDIENLSTVNLGAGRTAKVVAAGYEHTCAILDDDTLKCWGGNTHGQLGYDDTTQRGTSSSPMSSVVAVDLDDAGPVARTAKWITAGDYITCAVLDNDKIKCWGRGTYAALGQGNTDNYGTVASSGGGNHNISAVTSLPWTVLSTCDASAPPTNGGFGDCSVNLASGTTCQPTCNSGYTVSGTSSCATGVLTAATCVRNTCDASTAPANGAVGTCTNNLASGATCQPTCNSGYTVSGASSCLAGTLTAARCVAHCDASTAPTNGGVGDCTSSLPMGSTCQPTCNDGYRVSGVTSCAGGVYVPATCASNGPAAPSPSSDSDSNVGVIVGCVVGAFGLILLIVIICCCVSKRRREDARAKFVVLPMTAKRVIAPPTPRAS